MHSSRVVTALLLTAFAAGAQAQFVAANDKLAAAAPVEAKAAAPKPPAKPEPSLNQEGPFSVFTYEAIGATPKIQLGRAQAPSTAPEAVAARK